MQGGEQPQQAAAVRQALAQQAATARLEAAQNAVQVGEAGLLMVAVQVMQAVTVASPEAVEAVEAVAHPRVVRAETARLAA
jgi:hypothetical protein